MLAGEEEVPMVAMALTVAMVPAGKTEPAALMGETATGEAAALVEPVVPEDVAVVVGMAEAAETVVMAAMAALVVPAPPADQRNCGTGCQQVAGGTVSASCASWPLHPTVFAAASWCQLGPLPEEYMNKTST